MSTTLAVRFPLGRYHANPWGRAVNEGAPEWPPSPWRLLRALIATWHTRWPDLPVGTLEDLLDRLGDPPSYRTPRARPGHTRHYLPDLNHRKGETGRTDLTLDPFLSVPSGEELLIRWDADLPAELRQVLAKLAELLPYLGRSESVCEARLLDGDPVPDERWWHPGADGADRTQLLVPLRPFGRNLLETTTAEVQKGRRTIPPGTTWVDYASTRPVQAKAAPSPREPKVPGDCLRLAVISRVPVKLTHGILLADAVHQRAAKLFPDNVSGHVVGYNGSPTNHRHAHWIPLPGQTGAGRRQVESLLVYVPGGLDSAGVSRLISIGSVSGKTGGEFSYRDLPDNVRLPLQAFGPVSQVAPELCRPSRYWRSLTPYLPVRHRHAKRETQAEYLEGDVRAELSYRDLPPARVTQIEPGSRQTDAWASRFRRYRMRENLGDARSGLGLALEFPTEVGGPLLLGQLSHFGYGIFVPDPA